MTTVATWIGVDSRGPTSAYIASESRFSWGTGQNADTWDLGRKTFASSRFPDIAGYWGDVLLPVVVLSQFFATLDDGRLVRMDSSSANRFQALERMLRTGVAAMPTGQKRPFTVVYVARDGELMKSTFQVRTLSWSAGDEWARREFPTPSRSAAIQLGGSGATAAKAHLAEWNESSEGGTSRAVYSAFVDALLTGTDPLSGGAPQLVGVYRRGSGQSFGTVIGSKRYLQGLPMAAKSVSDSIEWRNELFERVSGKSLKKLPRAQQHRRPKATSTK